MFWNNLKIKSIRTLTASLKRKADLPSLTPKPIVPYTEPTQNSVQPKRRDKSSLRPRNPEGSLGPYSHLTDSETLDHVIHGDKPSALFGISDSDVSQLVNQAKSAGIPYRVEPHPRNKGWSTFYAAKDEDTLSKLITVHNDIGEDGSQRDPYTEGKLLGYTDADINEFRKTRGETIQTTQQPVPTQYDAEAEASRPSTTPVQPSSPGTTQSVNTQTNGSPSTGKKEDTWFSDKEHNNYAGAVSYFRKSYPGKKIFKTDKGWSIIDPSTGEDQHQGGDDETGKPPEEKKKVPLNKVDINNPDPEALKEIDAFMDEAHSSLPGDKTKEQIKSDTNKIIDEYINNVLNGKANEAVLPEMNENEKVMFLTALFMAERAKMVAAIKIKGRNRAKVQMAKELQAKIVGDLSTKANEYLKQAVKSIEESQKRPKLFNGSLNEFTNPNISEDDHSSPEAYINDYGKFGNENWDFNRRINTLSKGLIDNNLKTGDAISQNLFDAITEIPEDERNFTHTLDDATRQYTMSMGNSANPNSRDSLQVTLPLTANYEQLKEAFNKAVKALNKKNISFLMTIDGDNLGLNKDNIVINTNNPKDLEEIKKTLEKNLATITGTTITQEDNRFGLNRKDRIDILARMKKSMNENGDGTFHLEEDGKHSLAQYALVAKSLNSKIVDHGNGIYSLQAVAPNSNAYDNKIFIGDSDSQVLEKIKQADEKDKNQKPMDFDPNAELRPYLPEDYGKIREQRQPKQKQEKQPKSPKQQAVKPAPVPKPVDAPKPQEPDLFNQPEGTGAQPTPVGTNTYIPKIREASDLSSTVDAITDWNSQQAKDLIQDFNVSLNNAIDSYDVFEIDDLKKAKEQIEAKAKASGNEEITKSIDTSKLNSLSAIPSFVSKKELVGKGARDVFKVEPVTKDKLNHLRQLIQMKAIGNYDTEKKVKKLDAVKDGVWIQGKDGEFFSGWYEVEDFDGSKVFLSSDKDDGVMFKVNKEDMPKAHAFIKRNPYVNSQEMPRISNMEGFYKKDDFYGDSVPMSYTPSEQNLKSFQLKYPELHLNHPEGRNVLTSMLGLKNKLIHFMNSDQRKMAISEGLGKAITDTLKGKSISQIKSMLMDSSKVQKDSKKAKELNHNDEERKLISSISDDDFMKILSSVNVDRGNEEASKAKVYDDVAEKTRLTPDTVNKYLKAKGIEDPLLEYAANRPSGFIKWPEKGTKFYKQVMQLEPNIRTRIFGTKASTQRASTLDQMAEDFGSGRHGGLGSNERYQGTQGPENYLNDLVSSITNFYKGAPEAEQAEALHYQALNKKHTESAKKMISSPRTISGKDLKDGDLYKINGNLYRVYEDPEEDDFMFIDKDGNKKHAIKFMNKDGKIEAEGHIPYGTDEWDIIGPQVEQKIEEKTGEDIPFTYGEGDTSIEDLADDSYNPLMDSDGQDNGFDIVSPDRNMRKSSLSKPRHLTNKKKDIFNAID